MKINNKKCVSLVKGEQCSNDRLFYFFDTTEDIHGREKKNCASPTIPPNPLISIPPTRQEILFLVFYLPL